MNLKRKERFLILILLLGGLYWLIFMNLRPRNIYSTICGNKAENNSIKKDKNSNINNPTGNATTSPISNKNHNETSNVFAKTDEKTSHVSKLNFTWLANNPVYKRFKIKPSVVKKRVNLLVIVSSGPRRVDRRNAVRQTWWSSCKRTGEIVPECIFITDQTPIGSKHYNITQEESKQYGDIHFQNVPGGATFGLRMLNQMLYAVSHYEFDYVMIVDDDFFLCFQNILYELPLSPPLKRFHWGFVHLGTPGAIRPDECISIYSNDLIETFLLQDPDKMLCVPFSSLMQGVWSTAMDLNGVWHHDHRLWHDPPAGHIKRFKTEKDLCHNYIGLHGAYPKDMPLFWSQRGRFRKRKGNLKDYSIMVELTKQFDWKAFPGMWRYEPKLCKEDYKWDMSIHRVKDGSYVGRENTRR